MGSRDSHSERWKGSLALQVAADHAETGKARGISLVWSDGGSVVNRDAKEKDAEEAAFLSRVPKVKANECAIWTGCYFRRPGYSPIPRFQTRGRGRKMVMAGRYAWTMVHGPIKKKGLLYRTCFNNACMNVRHMWIGTQKDMPEYLRGMGFLPAKHARAIMNGPVQRKAKVIMARIRADFAELEKLHTRCYRMMRKELKLMRANTNERRKHNESDDGVRSKVRARKEVHHRDAAPARAVHRRR